MSEEYRISGALSPVVMPFRRDGVTDDADRQQVALTRAVFPN